jgi:hypothetical protein
MLNEKSSIFLKKSKFFQNIHTYCKFSDKQHIVFASEYAPPAFRLRHGTSATSSCNAHRNVLQRSATLIATSYNADCNVLQR